MRFLLLLAVLVIVLFCISLAVSKSNEGNKTKPTNSWAATFNRRFEEKQKLPASDLKAKTINGREVAILQFETPLVVTVLPNKSRSVRKTEMTLKGLDSFKVHYAPDDPEGVTLDIKNFTQAKTNKLVFQKNGGTLTFTRETSLGPATVTFK